MHTDKTIDFYDARAKTYFDDWKENDLLAPLLRTLMGRLTKTPTVLDLGCGPGAESRRLVDLGATVFGIDLGKTSLEIAREHVPEATFSRMDVRNLTFPSQSFDGVLDAAVLFHFTDDEQMSILGSLLRLLRPGGAYLSIFMTGDFRGLQEGEIEGRKIARYLNLKSAQAWTELVVSSGFRLLEAPASPVEGFSAAVFGKAT